MELRASTQRGALLAGSEFINLRDIPQSPLRAYAQTAVAGAREDQRQGVLAWRVATYLASQVRPYVGQSSLTLDRLSPAEQAFYVGLAHTVHALSVSIEAEAPPTPGEIARYESRKAVTIARSRVRCHAAANRHALGVWQPSREYRFDVIRCERCGAAATLSLDRAQEELSEALLSVCPGVGR